VIYFCCYKIWIASPNCKKQDGEAITPLSVIAAFPRTLQGFFCHRELVLDSITILLLFVIARHKVPQQSRLYNNKKGVIIKKQSFFLIHDYGLLCRASHSSQ
jgi:hypothetical protein